MTLYRPTEDKARKAKLSELFGHIRRGWGGVVRMLKLELPGRRRGERPKRRFIDVVKEHWKFIGVKEKLCKGSG